MIISILPTIGHGTRRRASAYIAVLGVSMIVAMAGISAVLVSRVQRRSSMERNDIAQARLLAQSGMEYGLRLISNIPSWRSMIPEDQWIGNFELGDGTFTWKVAGEHQLDLDGQVRLYGKGQCGQAVRMYSVLLRSEDEVTENILRNGDIEQGVSYWVAGGNYQVLADTSVYHDGTQGLWVRERNDDEHGALQLIPTRLEAGKTYYSEVWIRTKNYSVPARGYLIIESTIGGIQLFTFDYQTVGTSWSKLSGTVTPNWSGQLIRNAWYVHILAENLDFWIDDAVLVEGTSAPVISQKIIPQPRTLRREVLP